VYFGRNLPTLRRKVLPPYSASSYENFTLQKWHFRRISIRILGSSINERVPSTVGCPIFLTEHCIIHIS
jgi:hypothetical protein